MKCPTCYTEQKSDFCEKCGTKLRHEISPLSQKTKEVDKAFAEIAEAEAEKAYRYGLFSIFLIGIIWGIFAIIFGSRALNMCSKANVSESKKAVLGILLGLAGIFIWFFVIVVILLIVLLL